MSVHYSAYSDSLEPQSLVEAVEETRGKFRDKVLDNYEYFGDRQVLVFGDVQSGKTSHTLGIIADCLDNEFQTVLVLTSPNTRLVNQTLGRIRESLTGVLVCGPDEVNNFEENQDRLIPEKCVVVVGKVASTLENWIQVFTRTGCLRGNPILVVDDEADATSLDTKVNSKEQDSSTINALLTKIRNQSTGCLYLQVTGTPQALILQSEVSGWSLDESIFFEPGEGYVGGDTFFEEMPNEYLQTFSSSKRDEEIHLRRAIQTHLVTSALFVMGGNKTCNMMLHPSHLTPVHECYRARVERILVDVFQNFEKPEIQTELKAVYQQLLRTYPEAPCYESVSRNLRSMEGRFNLLEINSRNPTRKEDWRNGFNFIVGGNSLGRGLTFDYLQTVFYVRTSNNPQADTVWQHARMFGYKRHLPTMRCFMPGEIAKLFSEVHKGNEVIKRQLRKGKSVNELRVVLNGSLSPTRGVVLDKERVKALTGGVNYFAQNPANLNFNELDLKLSDLVKKHGNDFYLAMRAVSRLTEHFDTDVEDLDLPTFRAALEQYSEDNPHLTVRVIIRTGRKVQHGTGTLLSPDDRCIAKEGGRHPILILYRIEGVNDQARKNGRTVWKQDPIWVPSFTLPEKRLYWRVSG